MDLSNENIIHQKKNGVEFLQFRKLLEYNSILLHAYSLGIKSNYRTAHANKQALSSLEYEKAIQDYQKLCGAMGEDYTHLVKTNQTHSDHLVSVKHKILKNEPDFNLEIYQKTDGLVTNQKDMILSTTNADCILLLFFDSVQKVIANVHSGWRGTMQRISVKAVRKMITEYGCYPRDIICCICPSIRKCHFEVGEEVKILFEEEFQDLELVKEKIIDQTQEGKWFIDTVTINQKILQKEGLKEENIIDSGICSVCHSNLIHSYRVEKEGYGLGTALISLK